MQQSRPYVMSIAGFDPSGGAGVLADIKAFEANAVYGFGITSAITYQNDRNFLELEWLSENQITKQIKPIISNFSIEYAKIGIIENIEILDTIINYLLSIHSTIKIIWDPVLKASSGYVFHKQINEEKLFSVLRKTYLLTPNIEEAKVLFSFSEGEIENLQDIIKKEEICSVLLKGGHASGNKRNDLLITQTNIRDFEGDVFNNFSKHGTGCVLSSVITANLAKGKDLVEACFKAKEYIHRFIKSNKTLLGYHYEY